MTESEMLVNGGGVAVVIGFARWAVGVWAAVRREDIAAATASATAARESDIRMSDRQVAAIDRINATVNDHTQRDLAAQAEVKQVVARLDGKIDSALTWLQRASGDHSERRKARASTAAEGNPTR